MGKKKKYYVVWVGLTPGIYETWDECLRQTKGYPGAKYKSYPTKAAAEAGFEGGVDYNTGGSKAAKAQLHRDEWEAAGVILDSFCVDAACSGNPGIMEYRGVWTDNNIELFKMGPYQGGTNNIGEFLALVHALAYFNKTNKTMLIYTDSRTAMAWVRNKKTKTTLKKTPENAILFAMMDRAIQWLKGNTYDHKIEKWNTKEWGEIPADFGRK